MAVEEIRDTGSGDYRMDGQGPVHKVQSHPTHGSVGQYRDGLQIPVQNKERYTEPVLARKQTAPARRTPQTLEQQQYLTQLASQKDYNTTAKDTMMTKISNQLQGMGLKEIQRFEESLPSTISHVRHSKRLQGCPPEAFETTGNPVEDSRLLFRGDRVHYRK